MPVYKAIIFDLDGTLINTLQDITDAVNDMLDIMKFPQITTSAVRERLGGGMLNLMEQCLPADKTTETNIMKAIHYMGEAYAQRWNKTSTLYEGIPQVLDSLMLKRIPMGVLSNKPDPFTQTMCRYFLNKWDFSFTAGGREHLPLKPNPASAYMALERFQKKSPQLIAEEILFVGDGDTDIKTALSAGMMPLAALWGFRDKAQLAAVGAELFAEKPLEILDYFI